MFYKAVYFNCEVGVVVSSVAFGDELLVSIQYDVVEVNDVLVEVVNGRVVKYAEVLFRFLCEPVPVCFFVVCKGAVWVVGFSIGFG